MEMHVTKQTANNLFVTAMKDISLIVHDLAKITRLLIIT